MIPAKRQQQRTAQNADPLKREACLQVIVRFTDGNTRVFYSRDVDRRGTKYHQNLAYWTQYWKYRVEHETPDGWKGRVESAGFFYSYDGTRGDKFLQFDRKQTPCWSLPNVASA